MASGHRWQAARIQSWNDASKHGGPSDGGGAHDAIELDGGGSATLAGRDAQERPCLLSRPVHTKIPGRQRPVANHLGLIYARTDGP